MKFETKLSSMSLRPAWDIVRPYLKKERKEEERSKEGRKGRKKRRKEGKKRDPVQILLFL